MCSMLEKQKEDYNQAIQNFNWAEKEYVRKAICELTVAEAELKREKEEWRQQ